MCSRGDRSSPSSSTSAGALPPPPTKPTAITGLGNFSQRLTGHGLAMLSSSLCSYKVLCLGQHLQTQPRYPGIGAPSKPVGAPRSAPASYLRITALLQQASSEFCTKATHFVMFSAFCSHSSVSVEKNNSTINGVEFVFWMFFT